MTPVLPVPAPASTRMSWPPASIARACSGVGKRASLMAAPPLCTFAVPGDVESPQRSSFVLLVGSDGGPVAAADRSEFAEGGTEVVPAQAGARPRIAADVAAAHAGDDLAGAPAGVGQHLLEALAVDQVVFVDAVGGELLGGVLEHRSARAPGRGPGQRVVEAADGFHPPVLGDRDQVELQLPLYLIPVAARRAQDAAGGLHHPLAGPAA